MNDDTKQRGEALAAETVYILAKNGQKVSHNTRVEWFIGNVNRRLVFSKRGVAGQLIHEACCCDNVDAGTGADECNCEAGESDPDPPADWSSLSVVAASPRQLSSTCLPAPDAFPVSFRILPDTTVKYLAHAYRITFVIDLSESMLHPSNSGFCILHHAVKSIETVLFKLIPPQNTLELPVRGCYVNPLSLFISIIAVVPNMESFTIIHDWEACRESIRTVVATVSQRLYQLEIADVLTPQGLTDTGVTQPSHVGSHLVDMLRHGVLTLAMQMPDWAPSSLIIVSDGCFTTRDMSELDQSLVHLRASAIRCSFIVLTSHGFEISSKSTQTELLWALTANPCIPHFDLCQFIAHATAGFCLANPSEAWETLLTVNAATWNKMHELVLALQLQDDASSTPEKEGDLGWTPIEEIQPYSRVVRTAINHVLASRLKDGYRLRSVSLASASDPSCQRSTHIQIELVLAWKPGVVFHYFLTGAWHLPVGILPVCRSEDYRLVSTHRTPTKDQILDSPYCIANLKVRASGTFLHIVTHQRRDRIANWFLASTLDRFDFHFRLLNHVDNYLESVSSFNRSPDVYNVPSWYANGLSAVYITVQNASGSLEIHFSGNLREEMERDRGLARFVNYWGGLLTLDIANCYRWMHTETIYILLEHDSPMPIDLFVPVTSRSRRANTATLTFRQSLARIHSMLTNWCTFVLLENHTYILLEYPNKATQFNTPETSSFDDSSSTDPSIPGYFTLVRLEMKVPEVRVRVAFTAGVQSDFRRATLDHLSRRFRELSFLPRGRQAVPKSRHKSGTAHHPHQSPISPSPRAFKTPSVHASAAAHVPPLQRNWGETPCCLVVLSQLDRLIVENGTWQRDSSGGGGRHLNRSNRPNLEPSRSSKSSRGCCTSGSNSSPFVKGTVVEARCEVAPSLLRQHLCTSGRIWVAPLVSKSSNCVMQMFFTLMNLRIQEGFHFVRAGPQPGFVSLAREVMFSVDSIGGAVKQPCLIQYQLYAFRAKPPRVQHQQHADEQEEIRTAAEAVQRLLDAAVSPVLPETIISRLKALTAAQFSTDVQIATEVWIEPKHGHAVDLPMESAYLANLSYTEIVERMLQLDCSCLSAYHTLEKMLNICLLKLIDMQRPAVRFTEVLEEPLSSKIPPRRTEALHVNVPPAVEIPFNLANVTAVAPQLCILYPLLLDASLLPNTPTAVNYLANENVISRIGYNMRHRLPCVTQIPLSRQDSLQFCNYLISEVATDESDGSRLKQILTEEPNADWQCFASVTGFRDGNQSFENLIDSSGPEIGYSPLTFFVYPSSFAFATSRFCHELMRQLRRHSSASNTLESSLPIFIFSSTHTYLSFLLDDRWTYSHPPNTIVDFFRQDENQRNSSSNSGGPRFIDRRDLNTAPPEYFLNAGKGNDRLTVELTTLWRCLRDASVGIFNLCDEAFVECAHRTLIHGFMVSEQVLRTVLTSEQFCTPLPSIKVDATDFIRATCLHCFSAIQNAYRNLTHTGINEVGDVFGASAFDTCAKIDMIKPKTCELRPNNHFRVRARVSDVFSEFFAPISQFPGFFFLRLKETCCETALGGGGKVAAGYRLAAFSNRRDTWPNSLAPVKHHSRVPARPTGGATSYEQKSLVDAAVTVINTAPVAASAVATEMSTSSSRHVLFSASSSQSECDDEGEEKNDPEADVEREDKDMTDEPTTYHARCQIASIKSLFLKIVAKVSYKGDEQEEITLPLGKFPFCIADIFPDRPEVHINDFTVTVEFIPLVWKPIASEVDEGVTSSHTSLEQHHFQMVDETVGPNDDEDGEDRQSSADSDETSIYSGDESYKLFRVRLPSSVLPPAIAANRDSINASPSPKGINDDLFCLRYWCECQLASVDEGNEAMCSVCLGLTNTELLDRVNREQWSALRHTTQVFKWLLQDEVVSSLRLLQPTSVSILEFVFRHIENSKSLLLLSNSSLLYRNPATVRNSHPQTPLSKPCGVWGAPGSAEDSLLVMMKGIAFESVNLDFITLNSETAMTRFIERMEAMSFRYAQGQLRHLGGYYFVCKAPVVPRANTESRPTMRPRAASNRDTPVCGGISGPLGSSFRAAAEAITGQLVRSASEGELAAGGADRVNAAASSHEPRARRLGCASLRNFAEISPGKSITTTTTSSFSQFRTPGESTAFTLSQAGCNDITSESDCEDYFASTTSKTNISSDASPTRLAMHTACQQQTCSGTPPDPVSTLGAGSPLQPSQFCPQNANRFAASSAASSFHVNPPAFWLLFRVGCSSVQVYFHHSDTHRDSIPSLSCSYCVIFPRALEDLREIVRTVNQSLLLDQLYHERYCDPALHPEDSNNHRSVEPLRPLTDTKLARKQQRNQQQERGTITRRSHRSPATSGISHYSNASATDSDVSAVAVEVQETRRKKQTTGSNVVIAGDSDQSESVKPKPGSYACPRRFISRIDVSPRAVIGGGGAGHVLLELRRHLENFDVSNRRNMFVFVDSWEHSHSSPSPPTAENFLDTQLAKDGDGTTSVDGNQLMLAAAAPGTARESHQRIFYMLLKEVSSGGCAFDVPFIGSSVTKNHTRGALRRESLPCTTSTSASCTQSPQPGRLQIQATLHGIASPSHQLCAFIRSLVQNLLDRIVLERLQQILSRTKNLFRLAPLDLEFLLAHGLNIPHRQLFFRLPRFLTDRSVAPHVPEGALMLPLCQYLRQNLLTCMTAARAEREPISSMRSRLGRGEIMLYCCHRSAKFGLATVLIDLVSSRQTPSSEGYSITSFINHTEWLHAQLRLQGSKTCLTSLAELTACLNDIQFSEGNLEDEDLYGPVVRLRIWERGEAELDVFVQQAKSAIKRSVYDLITEYFVLTQPVCTQQVPMHENNRSSADTLSLSLSSSPSMQMPHYVAETLVPWLNVPGASIVERKKQLVSLASVDIFITELTNQLNSFTEERGVDQSGGLQKCPLLRSPPTADGCSHPVILGTGPTSVCVCQKRTQCLVFQLSTTPTSLSGQERAPTGWTPFTMRQSVPKTTDPGLAREFVIIGRNHAICRYKMSLGQAAGQADEEEIPQSDVVSVPVKPVATRSGLVPLQRHQNLEIQVQYVPDTAFRPTVTTGDAALDNLGSPATTSKPSQSPLAAAAVDLPEFCDINLRLPSSVFCSPSPAPPPSEGGVKQEETVTEGAHKAVDQRSNNTPGHHHHRDPLVVKTASLRIPRQSLCLMRLKNRVLSIYLYNWTQDDAERLFNRVDALVCWYNQRFHLLNSLSLQKMGLFHSLRNTNYVNLLRSASQLGSTMCPPELVDTLASVPSSSPVVPNASLATPSQQTPIGASVCSHPQTSGSTPSITPLLATQIPAGNTAPDFRRRFYGALTGVIPGPSAAAANNSSPSLVPHCPLLKTPSMPSGIGIGGMGSSGDGVISDLLSPIGTPADISLIVRGADAPQKPVNADLNLSRLFKDCAHVPSLGAAAGPLSTKYYGPPVIDVVQDHVSQALRTLAQDSKQARNLRLVTAPLKAWMWAGSSGGSSSMDSNNTSSTPPTNRPQTAKDDKNTDECTINPFSPEPSITDLRHGSAPAAYFSAVKKFGRTLHTVCSPILFCPRARAQALQLHATETTAEANYYNAISKEPTVHGDEGESSPSLPPIASPCNRPIDRTGIPSVLNTQKASILTQPIPPGEMPKATNQETFHGLNALHALPAQPILVEKPKVSVSSEVQQQFLHTGVPGGLSGRGGGVFDTHETQRASTATMKTPGGAGGGGGSCSVWMSMAANVLLADFINYMTREMHFSVIRSTTITTLAPHQAGAEGGDESQHSSASPSTPSTSRFPYALLQRSVRMAGIHIIEVFIHDNLFCIRFKAIELCRFARSASRSVLTGPLASETVSQAASVAAHKVTSAMIAADSQQHLSASSGSHGNNYRSFSSTTAEAPPTSPEPQSASYLVKWEESSRLCDCVHLHSFLYDFYLRQVDVFLKRQSDLIGQRSQPTMNLSWAPLGGASQPAYHQRFSYAATTPGGAGGITRSSQARQHPFLPANYPIIAFLRDLKVISPLAPVFARGTFSLLRLRLRLPMFDQRLKPEQVFEHLIEERLTYGFRAFDMGTVGIGNSQAIHKRFGFCNFTSPNQQQDPPSSSLCSFDFVNRRSDHSDSADSSDASNNDGDNTIDSTDQLCNLCEEEEDDENDDHEEEGDKNEIEEEQEVETPTGAKLNQDSASLQPPSRRKVSLTNGGLACRFKLPVLTHFSLACAGCFDKENSKPSVVGNSTQPPPLAVSIFIILTDQRSPFPRSRLSSLPEGLPTEHQTPVQWPAIRPGFRTERDLSDMPRATTTTKTAAATGSSSSSASSPKLVRSGSHEAAPTIPALRGDSSFPAIQSGRRCRHTSLMIRGTGDDVVAAAAAAAGGLHISGGIMRRPLGRAPVTSIATAGHQPPVEPRQQGDIRWKISYLGVWPSHQIELTRALRVVRHWLRQSLADVARTAMVRCHKNLLWYRLFDPQFFPSKPPPTPSSSGSSFPDAEMGKEVDEAADFAEEELATDTITTSSSLLHRGLTADEFKDLINSSPLQLDLLRLDFRLPELLAIVGSNMASTFVERINSKWWFASRDQRTSLYAGAALPSAVGVNPFVDSGSAVAFLYQTGVDRDADEIKEEEGFDFASYSRMKWYHLGVILPAYREGVLHIRWLHCESLPATNTSICQRVKTTTSNTMSSMTSPQRHVGGCRGAWSQLFQSVVRGPPPMEGVAVGHASSASVDTSGRSVRLSNFSMRVAFRSANSLEASLRNAAMASGSSTKATNAASSGTVYSRHQRQKSDQQLQPLSAHISSGCAIAPVIDNFYHTPLMDLFKEVVELLAYSAWRELHCNTNQN